MENNFSILDSIELVAKKSEGYFKNYEDPSSNLDFALRADVELSREIFRVSETLNCSFIAAFYFSIAAFLDLDNDRCTYYNIAAYLSQKQFTIRKHKSFFDELEEKGLVSYIKRGSNSEITIDEKVKVCLFKNSWDDFLIPKPVELYSLLEELSELKNRFEDSSLSSADLDKQIDKIKSYYGGLDLIKLISLYRLCQWEEIVLLFLISDDAFGKAKFNYRHFLKNYFIKASHLLKAIHQFNHRDLDLFKLRLVEFATTEFYDTNAMLNLTDEAKVSLLRNKDELLERTFTPKYCKLIEFKEISNQELYFSKEFKGDFKQLNHALKHQNFAMLMERFKNEKLPQALTTIFYGLPGTGKTESVYQLAKKTGRNVLLVNISSIKDKFVGESEKRLKEVFNSYRAACKYYFKTPILLFNEADALLSNRITIDSSVDMMNNALQNILLQEMEDFEGILIATTNNINNLDKAYDRRFLYKLKFNLPDKEASKMIWKSKIKVLSDLEYDNLSKNHVLSGGQISNISRKIIADNMLFGRAVTFQLVESYCKQENTFRQQSEKIGFNL